MLELVDPPVPSTTHPVMSADLQAALGAIQQGAEWAVGGPERQEAEA